MDSLELRPLRRAAGTVRLPGSKSISNRVLLPAALAQGETEVDGLLDADDTRVMREALSRLGVSFSGNSVKGVGGPFPVKAAELFLGNAGTAFRPLTAALAFSGGEYRLSGVPRMHERPIGDLVDALRGIGAGIDYAGKEGFPPLAIHPGKISLEKLRVRGDVSSQFLTALLMALPLSGKAARVEVQGELISKPYVEITLNVMKRFGVDVRRTGWRYFDISAGAYRSPGSIYVEGDASSHPVWRDAHAALDCTKRLVHLARKTGKRIHILHISTKEEIEYVDSIYADVNWLICGWADDRLGLKPKGKTPEAIPVNGKADFHLGPITRHPAPGRDLEPFYASDYFDPLYQYALVLIRKGKAYVCDLSPEDTEAYRGAPDRPGKESPFRNRGIEEIRELRETVKYAPAASRFDFAGWAAARAKPMRVLEFVPRDGTGGRLVAANGARAGLAVSPTTARAEAAQEDEEGSLETLRATLSKLSTDEITISVKHAAVGGPNIAPRSDGPIAECVAHAPGGPTHVLLSDREAEHLPGCNMAFRRSCLQAIGGFDPQFRVAGDDVDICWQLQRQGWTLGFSPAAVVWHHRRNSVRDYLRQQKGYGKAEALLERKWPEKYNLAGHLKWNGRVYGIPSVRWRPDRIYHGSWGLAPFQSLYQPVPGTIQSVLMMPE